MHILYFLIINRSTSSSLWFTVGEWKYYIVMTIFPYLHKHFNPRSSNCLISTLIQPPSFWFCQTRQNSYNGLHGANWNSVTRAIIPRHLGVTPQHFPRSVDCTRARARKTFRWLILIVRPHSQYAAAISWKSLLVACTRYNCCGYVKRKETGEASTPLDKKL